MALTTVLAEMHDGVQLFDCQGQLIYANRAAAATAGYDTPQAYLQANQAPAEGDGLMVLEATSGAPLAQRDWPCYRALRGHITAAQILRYRYANQQECWCLVKAIPLRDESSVVQYALVITQDISQQQQTARQLRDREKQLRHITDAVPSMIAYFDVAERHQYANRAYIQAFDQTPEAIVGKSLQQVWGATVYSQIESCLPRVLAGEATDFDLPLTTPNGQVCYKHVSLIPHYAAEQQVQGFYTLFNDITAHKRAADLLHDDAEHFRYALEGAEVGIWDWDLVSNEIVWSRQEESLFGLPANSFDGRLETMLAQIHPDDRGPVQTSLQASKADGNPYRAEFRVLYADQSVRWLSSRGQIFLDGDNRPVRMAGVSFDITPQKAAEDQLRHQIERERLMSRIVQDISRSQTLQDILQRIVNDVQVFLAVDRLMIIDVRAGLRGRVRVEAHSDRVDSMLTWELRDPWATNETFLRFYNQGRIVAVSNIYEQALEQDDLNFLEYFQIRAELIVPLLQDEELWGLLVCHQCMPRAWQPEDTRLLHQLATQISIALQRDRLHRELTEANQQLKRMAYLDGLTQVANRRWFEQYLNQEWRRLMREKAPLALIMADIDFFKAYNDLYGHQSGDSCLRRVAGILRSALNRPADLLARYGGEEFVAVLPNTDRVGAEMVADKIQTLIRSQRIAHDRSPLKIVTLSLGVAALDPHPLRSPDELIQRADSALYQAKNSGRDRVCCA